ncbi:precorrin-6y C5,15-methyltransferase (decarboxylating) subunit CbiE [Heliobacterium undosum]|uniref:Precorrin-6y C5,15-methyltransferase (Decarboxylating) subunit CbiE n=1 Tax=Heliomicrobium undosum TaxID=121734 RepID=A0A845L6J5_9FIRM|nr:precorrin-6y C5,15-methyltransferase (decarboxylating) subunit CbiE [Heliomicrobium undosum]MZP28531.1 precorrin-6y C5,15-methyltransferase (decarboxylating) subunit CbiE [Heliomicrobium undosum]
MESPCNASGIRPGFPVTVIGIGPGTEEYLTPAALRAVEEADVLVGGPRALALFAGYNKPGRIIDRRLDNLIDYIASERLSRRLAVLVSGDPGYYSLLPRLIRSLGDEPIKVIPGLSSLQMAFARLKLPWQEAAWKSMHGRPMEDALEALRHPGWVAFLTDPDHTPEAVAAYLDAQGEGERRAYVTRNLGYDDESVEAGTVHTFALVKTGAYQPSLLIVEGGFDVESHGKENAGSNSQTETILGVQPAKGPLLMTNVGLPDDAFIRGQVPMTKSDIRALTLVRAQVGPGDIVWDIGAGTGSISVEAALLSRGGRVFAVERGQAGCDLIEANARKQGVDNLVPVLGEAPEALVHLPAPDAVIIGGSGGKLPEILQNVWGCLKAGGRLVLNAVTVETVAVATQWLRERGISFQASQIQVNRLEPAGTVHLWKSQNPVVIIWTRKESG